MAQPANSTSKRSGHVFLFLGMVLAGALIYGYFQNKRPSEGVVIRHFEAHRGSYERLRGMLQEDQQVLRVADWGVEVTKAGIIRPRDGGFPLERYNEYLALLREVGGKVAYRGRGEHPESISVLVWASGWAADTKQIQICWFEHPPLNEKSEKHSPPIKHIDGNWYLWRTD